MSLAILFHFLCAQNVSDINLSIIRSKNTPTNYNKVTKHITPNTHH